MHKKSEGNRVRRTAEGDTGQPGQDGKSNNRHIDKIPNEIFARDFAVGTSLQVAPAHTKYDHGNGHGPDALTLTKDIHDQ